MSLFARDKLNKEESILELYDGQQVDVAKNKLISANVPALKYTAKGKELFAVAETLYGRWLESGEDIRLVERAVELCRRAVEKGYPDAVVRLGYYYDKDYTALDRTEEFRCRVACDYYTKIVYADAEPSAEKGVTPEVSFEELKKTAARMLLDMLACAPPSLSGYSGSRYSYKYNSDRIAEKLGIVSDKSGKTARERAAQDHEKFTLNVFDACKNNRTRAPLFGVIFLSRAEAIKLFSAGSAIMRMCGDINVWLNDGVRNVEKVNNTKRFTAFMQELQGDSVWLYFFNNNLGGHRYLNAKKRKALCELMRCDDYNVFKVLSDDAVQRGTSGYVCSDDDVYYYLKQKLTTLRSALTSLIEKITTDKDW